MGTYCKKIVYRHKGRLYIKLERSMRFWNIASALDCLAPSKRKHVGRRRYRIAWFSRPNARIQRRLGKNQSALFNELGCLISERCTSIYWTSYIDHPTCSRLDLFKHAFYRPVSAVESVESMCFKLARTVRLLTRLRDAYAYGTLRPWSVSAREKHGSFGQKHGRLSQKIGTFRPK